MKTALRPPVDGRISATIEKMNEVTKRRPFTKADLQTLDLLAAHLRDLRQNHATS
jgi:hypothetical protein